MTRYALQLAPLVFVRPGELRKAGWNGIDLEAGEWRIPAERVKMRTKHIVPLSSQAVAILRALQPLTGKGHYVFPGARSMASTLLNEQGWNRDAIERQLAHTGVLKNSLLCPRPVAGLPAMSAVARARRPPSPAFLDPPGYARQRPERTLLYQLVEQHYPAFRELRAAADRPLPDFGTAAAESLSTGRGGTRGSGRSWQQPHTTVQDP